MTTYSIYYDVTGYWDFVKCNEYPTFEKKYNAWEYLEENISNLSCRYLVFKDEIDYTNHKKLINE